MISASNPNFLTENFQLKNKLFQELKRGFLFFSVIFTLATIFSSALQLSQGQPTDTNFHILNRAAVVLIAVATIQLFDRVRLKSRLLSYLVPYAISLALVFGYVWLTGFVEPLHPNAYRDIFLNFTAVAFVVMLVIFAKDQWLARRGKRAG